VRALALSITVALSFLLLLAPGCSQQPGEMSRSAESAAETPAAAPATLRRERPLPAYEGRGIDGTPISLSALIGKRLLLFLFDPSAAEAPMVGRAVAEVAAERGRQNFEIVGVASAGSREDARAFVRDLDVEFPALYDASGGLARLLGIRASVALLVADASGYLVHGSAGFVDEGENPSALVESRIREWLRLPRKDATAISLLGERPEAPLFSAAKLAGGERFELASQRGRPVVLIFFLETCPHCHAALRFFKEALSEIPEAKRPLLVGVLGTNRTIGVRERLQRAGLDFFTVLLDPDAAIRSAYRAGVSVPLIFLIDAEGFLVSRTEGWRTERDPPLMRMRLAGLAGEEVPMLLHATGFSGNEFCTVCHQSENETWQLTNHATAFDSLVRLGSDREGACVGCHVVGWEEPGGFSLEDPAVHLENVGCETCHGRGGTHLDPKPSDAPAAKPDYEAICKACHDPKHSLGFEYARFLPRVSHKENLQLADLSPEEQRQIVEKRRRPRQNLLPSFAEYTGSESCKPCHEQEFATWSKQSHATTVAKLKVPEETGNAECLRCHTTAFGKPGGFPVDGRPTQLPDLAAVGCESCHGPGGEHVREETPKFGNIVALGDKCDSCVILQICGTCHDQENDPGFEFELLDKIELQRHGTTEAGTGKPLRSRAESQARDAT
jgi:peroxiredoxin